MFLIDLLFKFYFVYFRNRGRIGAEASNRMLVVPLTFNVFTLFLFIVSAIFRIPDLGRMFFIISIVLIFLAVGFLIDRIYVTKGRYEIVKINHPTLLVISGILFFFFSCIIFFLGLVYLLMTP
ncbi:MAG: hypothetical protein DYG99_15800 [Bacteroidetes bacterium CHB5]|nr:hypothetical protein [Bacteroidetes bacterium CHB5]